MTPDATPPEAGTRRLATPADIDAIVALIAEHPDQLLARTHDDVAQLIDTMWVIEIDGDIAGCCCLEVYSAKIAEVRSLAVRDRYRGRGFGARLAEAAVAEARRRRIPQILVVTSAVGFFNRLNFRTCLNEKYALFWEEPVEGAGPADASRDPGT